jgi:hypothetical protein
VGLPGGEEPLFEIEYAKSVQHVFIATFGERRNDAHNYDETKELILT